MDDGTTYEVDINGLGGLGTDWIGSLGIRIKYYSGAFVLNYSIPNSTSPPGISIAVSPS